MSCFILLLLIIIIIFFFFTISSNANIRIIDQVCRASRDPPKCQTSLSKTTPPNATVLQAVKSALHVSRQNLNTGLRMVREIRDASAHKSNKTRFEYANRCLEVLGYSQHRTRHAASPGAGPKDVRAWLSAVLAHEYGCLSGLKKTNVTKAVDFFVSSLIVSTGNVLGMMANYDDFGNNTGSWALPKTERDGFWEPVRSGSGPVGMSSGLKANVIVCKCCKAGCDYGTVQEAVRAEPDNSDSRLVIWIKTGLYNETVLVPFDKKNVVFLGDGMGKTVITGSRNVGLQGLSTYNTATVGIIGDEFMTSGITVENTAGPGANQVVAFLSDSDRSVVEGCEFLGHQDTLYASTLRHYYKSCRIQGTIDFIFESSAALFQDCLIFITPRQVNSEKGEVNTVTAHARMEPSQSTGFVFRNCVVNGTDAYMHLYYDNPSVHTSFLGRPWKEYSRTVYIKCTLAALISPYGWMPWSGDFALNTFYYGEYQNTGHGSNTSKRVNWSSQIPPDHVNSYTFQNFIG